MFILVGFLCFNWLVMLPLESRLRNCKSRPLELARASCFSVG